MTLTEIAVIVVVAGVAAGAYVMITRANTSSDFQGAVTPYVVAVDEDAFVEGDYHREGKVLAIDAGATVLDPAHDRLPVTARARTDQEVGTVALVRCERRLVGSYGYSWAKGYAHACNARLLAWPSRRMIAYVTAEASPPSSVRLAMWNHTAARPSAELAQRIAALPAPP